MKEMPDYINIYIEEIAERLSHGRAIAMVGAGFSKNAVKARSTNKRFLNWNELGDIFYKKIYRKEPDQNAGHYLDALKLASMVENMFGRSALNQLLQDHLPDEEYEPSILHKKLLELNWSDVFTTNYDTLLERAGKCISNRRYQPVVNMDDLVYSQAPRIIKLHGSFPHSRPFIISQEDYRRYPTEFAVFVNTVQQAIIENTLCLFGFSADDPNFLNWIGWIRDNLGANKTSKIYMITADPKLMFERTFLASRNIIVINMAECFEDGRIDYGDALESFLDKLLCCQCSVSRKDWADGLKYNKREWKRLPKIWHDWRKNYPGWIILPEKNRDCFEKSLKLFTANWLQEIERDCVAIKWFSIQEVSMYEWVRQLCMLLLTDEVSGIYKNILDKTDDIAQIADLGISLLTFYRQNGRFKEFSDLVERMDGSEKITAEQHRRILCEKAYFALYRCEYMHLDQCLSEWPDIQYDCSFELMHIKIMWEAEQYKQALESLVTMLNTVRAEENGVADLYILSQEAYILNLMKQLSDRREEYWYEGSSDYGEYDRINYLKSYDCNPENEIELFKMALSGSETVILEDDCYKRSAQFINFYERIGIGCVIGSNSDTNQYMKKAILCIVRHNLYWGMVLSIQTWDTQFMRKAITAGTICASGKETNRIEKYLCLQIRRQMNSIRENKEMDYKEHRYLVWEEYMPDMTSALLMKSSESVRDNAFGLIMELQKMPDVFLTLDSFVLPNMFYSMDGDYMRTHIEELLCFILYLGSCEKEKITEAFKRCDFMLYDLSCLNTDIEQILSENMQVFEKPEEKDSEGMLYVKALAYHISRLSGFDVHFDQKGFCNVVKSGKYPLNLDFYFFVYDMIENEGKEMKSELLDKIKVRLKEELKSLIADYRNEDDEKLLFTLPVIQKIRQLYKQYKISWTIEEAENMLAGFLSAKNVMHMSSQRRCFLLGNIYPFFLDILWRQEFHWEETDIKFCCDLAREIGAKDDVCAKQHILVGLYSAKPEEFIISACIFFKYLKEDVDQWKTYLSEIQAVLFTKIQSGKAEAPFCIELLGLLLLDSGVDVLGQIRKEALVEVLRTLLELHTDSFFVLLMKAYGAKLASDIYMSPYRIKEVDQVLEEWKELCANKNEQTEHVLVRKQWNIVTCSALL